jgi:hypothetical protein
MSRHIACWTSSLLLLAVGVASPQETQDQADALALLAKIDGKAKFDPENPKRVIGIDI